jgi:hypothetical protein
VRALIVDDANRPARLANHHHRLAAEVGREIIAGPAHLTLVTDIDPGDAKDAPHLQLEDRRIGVQATVNASRANELRKVFRRRRLHGLLSLAEGASRYGHGQRLNDTVWYPCLQADRGRQAFSKRGFESASMETAARRRLQQDRG